MANFPTISICIPAYNRPNWLKRALLSITTNNNDFYQKIEIIVSDDSTDINCEKIAQEILKNWQGKSKYIQNKPSLGMAENWNNAAKLATGKYILILHDDDFLLPNALKNIIKIIEEKKEKNYILLGGVNVVNETETIIKKQTFKTIEYLDKKTALIKLLSNSSFVRFPAIIIDRKVFEEVGYFDPQFKEPADLEMWIRIFSKYGVLCLPFTTCAYTVHSEALTMGLFNENTINILLKLFEKVASLNIFSQLELKKYKAKFFHQFILGGAFRKLKRKQLNEFHQIMKLFNLVNIKKLNIPLKWFLIRFCFEIINIVTIILMKYKIK